MTGNDLYHLGLLALAVAVVGWWVRQLTIRVDRAADRAEESHVKALIERERAERVRADCLDVLAQCKSASAAAWGYAIEAEEAAESVEPADTDDDEEDGFYRP